MEKAYKIAFFTKNKRRTLYSIFIIRALRRIGCKVSHINMAGLRRLVGMSLAHRLVKFYLQKYRPDAGIIFSGDIQIETLDYLRNEARTALVLDDYFPLDAPVTEKIKKVDVFFHTMTGQLEEYKTAGVARPVYLHSGVDPQSHRRVRPHRNFASEVAFIGKAIYPHRIELIQRLNKDFALKVYGSGWREHGICPVRNEVAVRDFARVCASATVIFGSDKALDQELYFSNRTWFVLGCGGFLVTNYIPGLERVFANHRHLVWYRSYEEAADHIRFYLAHPLAREKIAQCGYEYVHRHYPFDRMAATIISVLFHGREPAPLTDPGPPLKRGEIDSSGH